MESRVGKVLVERPFVLVKEGRNGFDRFRLQRG